MKMVSQLTKQAMSRHRLLSAAPYPSAPVTAPQAPQPRTLYSAPLPPQPAAELPQPPAQAVSAPPRPAPLPVQSRQTIYGELMKKHDRFTERHILR